MIILKVKSDQLFLFKVLCDYLLAFKVKSDLLNKTLQGLCSGTLPPLYFCFPSLLSLCFSHSGGLPRGPCFLGPGRCCSYCLLYFSAPHPPLLLLPPDFYSLFKSKAENLFLATVLGECRCPCSVLPRALPLPITGLTTLLNQCVVPCLCLPSDCQLHEGGEGFACSSSGVRQGKDLFEEKKSIKIFIALKK